MLSVDLLRESLPPREFGDWCRLLVLPGLFWAWSIRNRPTVNQLISSWTTGFYVYIIAKNGGKLMDDQWAFQPIDWPNLIVFLLAFLAMGFSFIPLRRK